MKTELAADDSETCDEWLTEYGPARPEEWNFSGLTDKELIACCYWEYARESHTIKLMAEEAWCRSRHQVYEEAYRENPELLKDHDEHEQRARGWIERAGSEFESAVNRFFESELYLIHIFRIITRHVTDGALPWVCLSDEFRAAVCGELGKALFLSPVAPALVGELEELWLANSTDLMEVRAEPRPPGDDCEDCALVAPTDPVVPSGGDANRDHEKLTVGLTVDFSLFTDNEILDEFKSWLKNHRPGRWKTPRRVIPNSRQRGKKLVEYRAALDRLGLMRLLHWYSPSGLAEELPEAWARIRHKEPDFRREVRMATKFFRQLFPFLPAAERPTSEERFGRWMPEMMKICDEVEREMAEGADNRN